MKKKIFDWLMKNVLKGTVVITKEKALFGTDGRYWNQAGKRITFQILDIDERSEKNFHWFPIDYLFSHRLKKTYQSFLIQTSKKKRIYKRIVQLKIILPLILFELFFFLERKSKKILFFLVLIDWNFSIKRTIFISSTLQKDFPWKIINQSKRISLIYVRSVNSEWESSRIDFIYLVYFNEEFLQERISIDQLKLMRKNKDLKLNYSIIERKICSMECWIFQEQ